MKSRPILFSGPMVRAILDGSKTQTRRIVQEQQDAKWQAGQCGILDPGPVQWNIGGHVVKCPYGSPGDQLWVKETYRTTSILDHCTPIELPEFAPIYYEQLMVDKNANYLDVPPGRIRQSIYMRKWMSRITLKITSVRVERLQDISEKDAKAEGCSKGEDRSWAHQEAGLPYTPYKTSYSALWDSINGEKGPGEHGYSWAGNPWVWVITFKRISPQ